MANHDTPFLENLRTAVRDHQVVILNGRIGDARIREIIQYLSGYNRETIVACTRTRNVESFAAEFAAEFDMAVGGTIGCTSLLGDTRNINNAFRFFRDGFLLLEAVHNRTLIGYNVFVVDQVGERTLATDVCIGYLKWILFERSEARLILTGVGKYCGLLRQYFANSAVIVAGPTFLDLNTPLPLIKVGNISSVCLILLRLHRSPRYFDYLTDPPEEILDKAKQYLLDLGAITKEWRITDLGLRLAILPLSPQMGFLLLTGCQYNCAPEMLTICSMMAVTKRIVNSTNNLLMELFDYLVLIKLEEVFQRNSMKLASLLDFTHFSTVDSLIEALRAASGAKITLSRILIGMGVEVDRTNGQQHPSISLTQALVAGRTNVEKLLVAGYAGLHESLPQNRFWTCEELP